MGEALSVSENVRKMGVGSRQVKEEQEEEVLVSALQSKSSLQCQGQVVAVKVDTATAVRSHQKEVRTSLGCCCCCCLVKLAADIILRLKTVH